jgi:hypothetical protein
VLPSPSDLAEGAGQAEEFKTNNSRAPSDAHRLSLPSQSRSGLKWPS